MREKYTGCADGTVRVKYFAKLPDECTDLHVGVHRPWAVPGNVICTESHGSEICVLHDALAPPLVPVHVHVHGPVPAKLTTSPAAQRP